MRFLIPLLLLASLARAQESPKLELIEPGGTSNLDKGVEPQSADGKIYTTKGLQVIPEYPGGIVKLQNNLAADILKNVQLPKDFKDKLFISFVVEKDGNLSDIRVLRDPGHKIGLFAERFMRGNKVKWSSGILNGLPVRTLFTLPVEIKSAK